MRLSRQFEFPPEQEAAYRKARRLEWLTLAYIASAATALFVTMGSSQAMRTSFYEDVISSVPSIAFLVGTAIARRAPRDHFPFGFHRATAIAYLVAALALLGMGGFLLMEAVMKVLHGERTTIGGMHIFGQTVWAGWPMFAAIAWSAVPAVLLGRVAAKLAPKIHDKVLFAQADMMKADWMAESATAIGVLGVGLGFWWVDPLAAAVVSLDILKDGVTNVKVAVSDLMDRRPMKADRSAFENTPEQLKLWLEQQDWVREADVRQRDEGHVFFSEAFVTVEDGVEDLPTRVRETLDRVKDLNWRLHDLTITPVDRL